MFEWDAQKSETNLRTRGFDFAYAALVFENPVIEFDDTRRAYGELRLCAVGVVEDDVLFVVFTWRSNERRIISARAASRKEREAYHEIFG